MVKLRHDVPRRDDGKPDVEAWLDLVTLDESIDADAARAAVALLGANAEPGIELAQLLIDLLSDTEAVVGALLYTGFVGGGLRLDDIERRFSKSVSKLVADVFKTASTGVLNLSNSPMLAAEAQDQVDNVRHMLVAMIDDPRVAVIRLAERVVALRLAKTAEDSVRRRMAEEAIRVYAPLANRLGIGQLKWALEDLSFRYLHPEDYVSIASRLDGRRDQRERQIQDIVKDLGWRLDRAGLDVDVEGRAKHIYSIWRKMREKRVDFDQIHDVQAVRVLVDSVGECYAALGVVHTSWPHIPSEFDDYIANPKDNGYRSIHTAVIGPTGKTLEVQIRTHEMHREAELGVCAHWAYKGENAAALQSDKLSWLRQVLEWHDELEEVRGELLFDAPARIYVSTPQGHVLDLTEGATPVDFAYRVHTEIGHRCRGAVVDGVEVPLATRLRTGQCVEIITGEDATPRREWLDGALGYVHSARARSKIQAWFRAQLAELNIEAGRALLLDTFERLEIEVDVDFLASNSGYSTTEEMLLAVGVGDQHVIDLVKLIGARERQSQQLSLLPTDVPPELAPQSITVVGADRPGLLRDIATVLAALNISVVGTRAYADRASLRAHISLDLAVENLLELAQAIDRVRRITDVEDVRRT